MSDFVKKYNDSIEKFWAELIKLKVIETEETYNK